MEWCHNLPSSYVSSSSNLAAAAAAAAKDSYSSCCRTQIFIWERRSNAVFVVTKWAPVIFFLPFTTNWFIYPDFYGEWRGYSNINIIKHIQWFTIIHILNAKIEYLKWEGGRRGGQECDWWEGGLLPSATPLFCSKHINAKCNFCIGICRGKKNIVSNESHLPG